MRIRMKIVLAYSGGLDTSVIIPWLKENYGAEVITVSADLGQGEELAPVRQKAIKSGASGVYIEDVREEFVRDYIFPTLRAGAVYEGKYLLGTSVARPLIAKKLVEVAHKEKADAIAHGATGKGNDQVRFEVSIMALDPSLKVVAPWREWDIRSREDAMIYAEKHGIPVTATKARPYSQDRNLWHLSHEGGILEDPQEHYPNDLPEMTTLPEEAPNEPEFVSIDFEQAIPVAVNGQSLAPVELVSTLNALGGKHGVGILSMVENRLVGMKSRGVYETPGGTLLYEALSSLESITLDRATSHLKQQLAIRYGELVYDGLWFSPTRAALDAFMVKAQEKTTGTVKLKLYKGNVITAGISSPYSLYDPALSTFERDDVYNQKDAEGFIRLFGLPLAVIASRQGE